MTDEAAFHAALRAAGMLANPKGTERLHEYWVHGEGAAKIRWGEGGDFDRCVLHLGKFIKDPQGYCAKAHHAALGIWPATHAAMEKKVRRSAVADTKAQDYDADGLDSSWDGDNSDLPDLTGLGVEHMRAAEKAMGMAAPDEPVQRAMPKLGTGARFKKLSSSLAAKGAHDPGALAAYIGRRKFGKGKFTKLAAKARSGGSASRMGGWRDWEPRPFPLEDIHILTRAEGYGSGTVVEAYASVFDQPAPIHDGQGSYTEIIDRTAFDQTLAKLEQMPGGIGRAVKVLYNHGKTAEGQPAPEFQLPIGVPVSIRPESRGLLTRTDYDASDPFTERVLSKVKSGAINTYSFQGSIMRSDPELRGPGDRYRRRNGVLTTVRRMALGLREYGPVLWAAYTGAEILGVRMGLPGSATLEDFDLPEDQECTPETEGDAAGGAPEDATSSRYHQHELYLLRSREQREANGLTW